MKQEEIRRWGRARSLRAVELRRQGMTYRRIGELLGGVSDDRARQIEARGLRILNWEALKAEEKRERDEWERTLRLRPEYM